MKADLKKWKTLQQAAGYRRRDWKTLWYSIDNTMNCHCEGVKRLKQSL